MVHTLNGSSYFVFYIKAVGCEKQGKKQFSGFGVVKGEKGIEILTYLIDSVTVMDT